VITDVSIIAVKIVESSLAKLCRNSYTHSHTADRCQTKIAGMDQHTNILADSARLRVPGIIAQCADCAYLLPAHNPKLVALPNYELLACARWRAN
jgi:hypothetical protein